MRIGPCSAARHSSRATACGCICSPAGSIPCSRSSGKRGTRSRCATRCRRLRLQLEFAPTDFIQINAAVNETLVARALRAAGARRRLRAVLDLYCGIGNFTLALARRARLAVGVEGGCAPGRAGATQRRTARALAMRSFTGLDLGRCSGARRGGLAARSRTVHVLLDPPRAGAHGDVADRRAPCARSGSCISPAIRAVWPGTLVRWCTIMVSCCGRRACSTCFRTRCTSSRWQCSTSAARSAAHDPRTADDRSGGRRSSRAEDRELLHHPLVGGVILFTRNYVDSGAAARLVAAIHAERSPPLIVAVDQEGGRVQRFSAGFSTLPAARAASAMSLTWMRAPGLELARRLGWLMAAELRAYGVDLSFAPCVDLDYGVERGDRRSRLSRAPEAVAQLAVAYMHGMRDAGMAATAKHFPGHGAVVADSHLSLPVDRRELADLQGELAPYRRLIANGLPAVMAAHVCSRRSIARRPASRGAGFEACCAVSWAFRARC